MKNLIFLSFISFIQLFLNVQSRAINNDVSIVYHFDVELDKYKRKWDVVDIEGEIDIPENNIFKRMALEDDEEFERKLKELEDIEDEEEIVDEIPNEFVHTDKRLLKRATTSSSQYFKNQLSSFETDIYNKLYSISNVSTISKLDFTLTDLKSLKINKDNILKYSSRGIGALIRDHPEFWWIKKYSISYSSSNNYITKLKVTISSPYSISTINSYKSKVKNKAVGIADAAKNNRSTTYKRLMYIHDYLVKYIKYKDNYDYSFNMYGALIKNASACEGYAESFTYISRLINVPVICVSSSSHKWNYVYLKPNWYAVDVTFDDPTINGVTYNSGESKNLSHKFFLVGRNTVVKGNKTYSTYSDRKLVSYVEFTTATGFKFPTLSSSAYNP